VLAGGWRWGAGSAFLKRVEIIRAERCQGKGTLLEVHHISCAAKEYSRSRCQDNKKAAAMVFMLCYAISTQVKPPLIDSYQ